MKHTFFYFLMIAACVLCGCKKENKFEPEQMLFTNDDVDFQYRSRNPFEIECSNLSKIGLTATLWEMGDGKAYNNGDHVQHTYANAGTYTITLTCKDKNGYSYTNSQSVKFNSKGKIGDEDDPGTDPQTPDYISLKSIEFTSLPETNAHYKFTCTFKAKTGSDYVLNTGDLHITQDDLPYTFTLQTPKEFGTTDEFLVKYSEISVNLKCAYMGQYKDIFNSTTAIDRIKAEYLFYNSSYTTFISVNMDIQ